MASLKSLKLRIGSVKSTQKITKAMKMVAAAKLRRAQPSAEAGRPYSTRLAEMVSSLTSQSHGRPDSSPRLIAGTGKDDTHLIVVVTSDRGLAGAFNTNIVRAARKKARGSWTPRARTSCSTSSAARAARRSSASLRRRSSASTTPAA